MKYQEETFSTVTHHHKSNMNWSGMKPDILSDTMAANSMSHGTCINLQHVQGLCVVFFLRHALHILIWYMSPLMVGMYIRVFIHLQAFFLLLLHSPSSLFFLYNKWHALEDFPQNKFNNFSNFTTHLYVAVKFGVSFKRRTRQFESKVLSRILRPEWGDITKARDNAVGDCVVYSPCVIMFAWLTQGGWDGTVHAECIRKWGMFIECISGKLRERDQMKDTGLDGQIILKCIFERLYILGPE